MQKAVPAIPPRTVKTTTEESMSLFGLLVDEIGSREVFGPVAVVESVGEVVKGSVDDVVVSVVVVIGDGVVVFGGQVQCLIFHGQHHSSCP
jgi:hypothetical protein